MMFWRLAARVFVYLVFSLFIYSILRILVKIGEYHRQMANGDTTVRAKLETRQEPLNLVGMVVILLTAFVLVNIKVGFEFDGSVGDLPGKIMVIVPAVVGVILLFSNLIQQARGKRKVRRFGLESEQKAVSDKAVFQTDLRRKFYHIFVFFLVFGFLASFLLYLRHSMAISADSAQVQAFASSFWGTDLGVSYTGLMFIRHSMPLAQTLTFLFMYGAAVVLLTVDLTRLSHRVHFILQKESQRIMRYKELDTLGSYTHFALAYFLVSILLPPMLFLATLCLASFADPAASIVGIKFGKRRYPWNAKSLEGTIAGGLAAFLSMFGFVGPIYASVGAAAFMAADLLTPKPLKASDNLVMPLLLAAAFIGLSLMGAPYQPYFF